MSADPAAEAERLTWWRCEPSRLDRDRSEIADVFSDLIWIPEDAGAWVGALPLWPFDRPAPPGLTQLAGPAGLKMQLCYGQAYPMVPPSIYPLSPLPELAEWTVHDWHVNGDGSLCLLQTHSLWDPGASVVDLLLKAAGWRIEYALMKAKAITAMSVNGIVSDTSFDQIISEAAQTPREGA
jgi:hypothetical protein